MLGPHTRCVDPNTYVSVCNWVRKMGVVAEGLFNSVHVGFGTIVGSLSLSAALLRFTYL